MSVYLCAWKVCWCQKTMYVCANQDEHCGLSQPVIYMLLSNELTVQKKKKKLNETQSACHGIGGRLANQNTDTSLIELSCCVLSPRLCVLKSNQSR